MRDPPDSSATVADPGSDAFGQDWATLWQSELAAILVDRELQEAWRLLTAYWLSFAAKMIGERGPWLDKRDGRAGGQGTADSAAARSTRSAEAAGAAASAAPLVASLDEVEYLRCRVTRLEQRLGDLEKQQRPARRKGPERGRKQRS